MRCHFGDRLNAGRRRTARLNTSVRVSRMAAPARRRLGMDWLAGYRGSGRADDPLPVYAKPSPAAGGAAVSWVDGAAAAARASMTNRRRSRRRRVERSVTVARRRASSTLHTERSYLPTIAVPTSGWLGSRVVSVLDSGAEGPGFKSQSQRCRVTVLAGKLFTPVVPLFTKQQNW